MIQRKQNHTYSIRFTHLHSVSYVILLWAISKGPLNSNKLFIGPTNNTISLWDIDFKIAPNTIDGFRAGIKLGFQFFGSCSISSQLMIVCILILLTAPPLTTLKKCYNFVRRLAYVQYFKGTTPYSAKM